MRKSSPAKNTAQANLVKVLFIGGIGVVAIIITIFFLFSTQIKDGTTEDPQEQLERITGVTVQTIPQKVLPGSTFTLTWSVSSTNPITTTNTAAYMWSQRRANFGLDVKPSDTQYNNYAPNYLNEESQLPGTFSAELTAPMEPGVIFVRAHAEYLGKNYWSDEYSISVETEQTNFDEPPVWQGEPLNFVVIYTDDQRWDTLWAMQNIQNEFVEKGVNFENAFQTTPVCCPSRASILSGGFLPINTGVLTNGGYNGGASAFEDELNIGVLLQRKGYATGLFGKYLNHYREIEPRVPPGWTKFVATDRHVNWFDYDIIEGSSTPDSAGTGSSSNGTQYLTDYFGNRAVQFIDEHADEKFFVYFAPTAPHKPATAAPGDETKFSDFTYSSPGTRESDLSDKPSFVQDGGSGVDEDDLEEGGDGKTPNEDFFKNQLRSLLAVDRNVKKIIDKLAQEGLLDKTMIVFSSDNGLMWGEHGLYFKSKPYEESIRVPLIVRMPTVEKTTVSQIVSANLDIPTTILRLAGDETKTDGLDFYGLMKGVNIRWREGLAFQIFNQDRWVAWRTDQYKYVKYENGETEFYDLLNDPHELESKHNSTAFRPLMDEFEEKLAPFVGLRIDTFSTNIPRANPTESYRAELKAYGGKPPYKWTIVDPQEERGSYQCFGRLPNGLAINDNGVISGIPIGSEDCFFGVRVTDNSVSAQNGNPQSDTIQIGMRSSN